MNSRSVGDQLCAKEFRTNFVMAEFGDGGFVAGIEENNICLSTCPLRGANGGIWSFYSYRVKDLVWTRFWIAIDTHRPRCWGYFS